MFGTSSLSNEYSDLSAGSLDSLSGLGLDSLNGLSGNNSAFQTMLAQLLLRLLDRLEATDPTGASSAAASGANGLQFSASQATYTQLTWVYPGQTAAAAAAQAYGAANTPAASAATQPAATTTCNCPYCIAAAAAAANPAASSPAAPAVTVPADTAPITTAPVEAAAPTTYSDGVMAIADFPHPPDDNGRGMHWIPTVGSSPEVVDKFVAELKAMHIKWVTFLNDGASTGGNDYLVQQLKANGMEPVLRVYTPGLQPISGDLGAMVRHYKELGVDYFQLYNEPNHSVENDGANPDVNRYLDLWIPAARTVAENGGLPGFGALSPGGQAADTDFLAQALDGLKARGETILLDHACLSIHNCQGDRNVNDPAGFARFQVYANTLQDKLGRLMPMIGTEGGTFTNSPADEPHRIQLVTDAYRYMAHREPYNFAYSYWVVANQAGGGHDGAWEWQALIHPDGQSPLVDALKALA